MASKRISQKKAKNRKNGLDDEPEIKNIKGDDLCAIVTTEAGLMCVSCVTTKTCNNNLVVCAVQSCDGGCHRSFHLNEKNCRLFLGLGKEQAKMTTDNKDYRCKNCMYKQHQCFACGKLGTSDLSSGAEVFQCGHDDCAHLYHPKCVAELLYPDTEMEAQFFELQIAAGQGFECPVHECSVCMGGENKDDTNLRFAVCRRCPTTYHRKCLPGDILTEEGPNGEVRRAWNTLEEPDGRFIHLDPMLIYCTKHEIIEKWGTPKPNHIVFPKLIREPKVLVATPIEEDIHEEDELPDHHHLPEPLLPPLAARDRHQCSCSSPLDSFAPSSLFPHPHPGSGGWLGD